MLSMTLPYLSRSRWCLCNPPHMPRRVWAASEQARPGRWLRQQRLPCLL